MQILDLSCGLIFVLITPAKDRVGIVQQLPSPLLDLVGMNIKLICQLCHRPVSLQCCQGHLGLEGR